MSVDPWFSESLPKALRSAVRVKRIKHGSVSSHGWAWPSIVPEVGYTENYEDLKSNTQLLLESSRGQIGSVILIKLFPVDIEVGEKEMQNGFVEDYVYNRETGQQDQHGSRMVG